MTHGIPKISVLMICYNQEDYISRALDSLIEQKDFIYEICINDDDSMDMTWEIIQEYYNTFPNLIKPIRNSQNLGIFRNIEATWKRPTGDLIYRLAGDDQCPKDYFMHIIDFIQKNKIDYLNKAISIYGDYQQIDIDGSSIIYRNNMVENVDAIKLKIRQLLSNRSACFSKKVIDRYVSVAEGRSYIVELSQDSELQMFSDKNYYLPQLGNIYYAGIGVSKHFTKEEREEHLKVYDHFLTFCKEHSILIDNSDRNYIEYMKCLRRGQFLLAFMYFFKSIDLSLGWRGLQLDRIGFVLRKRILKR